MSDDKLGFKVGISWAHCRHCGYQRPLNTAPWILWLHLMMHPKVFTKMMCRKLQELVPKNE